MSNQIVIDLAERYSELDTERAGAIDNPKETDRMNRTYAKPPKHVYSAHFTNETWNRLLEMAEKNQVSINAQITASVENTWADYVAETNEEMIGQVEDTNANL